MPYRPRIIFPEGWKTKTLVGFIHLSEVLMNLTPHFLDSLGCARVIRGSHRTLPWLLLYPARKIGASLSLSPLHVCLPPSPLCLSHCHCVTDPVNVHASSIRQPRGGIIHSRSSSKVCSSLLHRSVDLFGTPIESGIIERNTSILTRERFI